MTPVSLSAAPPTRSWSLGAVLAERRLDAHTWLLVIRGDAGPGAAFDLRRRLLALRLAGCSRVIADLDGAAHVTPAILASLMHGRRTLAARGGTLVVIARDPRVQDALVGVGLELVDGVESV